MSRDTEVISEIGTYSKTKGLQLVEHEWRDEVVLIQNHSNDGKPPKNTIVHEDEIPDLIDALERRVN